MTERFPEQRNRFAQRRADAPKVPASAEESAFLPDVMPVFDDSFVAAAPVREPSAQARALMARGRTELSADYGWPLRAFDQPLRRWVVRPSHRLRALRLPAVAVALGCALAVSALLFILLR